MALTPAQQAAYDSLVASGMQEQANNLAIALNSVNSGSTVQQAIEYAAAGQPLYQSLTAQSTPDQIAAAYKEFVNAAGGDTASNRETAASYLSNLGLSAPTINQAYTQYAAPTSATEQNTYFAANPDVAAAYAQNSYGMTPDEFAQYHYQNYGQNESRTAPSSAATTATTTTSATAAASPVADYTGSYGNQKNITISGSDVQNVYNQIMAQYNAGTSKYYSGQGFGSPEANIMDMAKNLVASGVTDISQVGQGTVKGITGYEPESGQPIYGDKTVIINKETGQPLLSNYAERTTGDAWSGTFAGSGNTGYRVQFDANGNPVFYTTGASSSDLAGLAPLLSIGAMLALPGLGGALASGLGVSSAAGSALAGGLLGGGTAALTGGDVLKGALLGGAGGYVAGGGLSDLTGAGDFAGINSSLTPAQIESGLGTAGYGYGAQAASSGLFDPALIGAGAYTQTSYPYDYADLAAADTIQLYGQVGANAPAIEQNLIASGVDPLIAADAANQVILNPGLSVSDLTNYINTNYTGTGGIYDVNTANVYPTSTLPGAGGLLSQVPGSTTATTTTTTPATTTTTTPSVSDISTVLKALGTSGLLSGAISNIGGSGVGVAPTQGVPVNNADYYNAIQQYYNTYMPTQPRDVATPLQQWYSGAYKQQA